MKYILVGTERSGTTLLAAILANSGANFGMNKNRKWYRGSGDYEHQLLINNYKHLKRSKMFSRFSDRLEAWENRKIRKNLKKLFSEVTYAKYPPLSELLPIHLKNITLDFRLICIIRKFNDFALSRIAKKGGDVEACKKSYLSTYQTSLLNLSLYGGCIICYEDLINAKELDWARVLEATCGISAEELIQQRKSLIKPNLLNSKVMEMTFDEACTKVYNDYYQISKTHFIPAFFKQHIKEKQIEDPLLNA